MKDLCLYGVDAALKKGARFADARIVRLRDHVIATEDYRVESTQDVESLGIGIRVIADGAWGFAASSHLRKEDIAKAAARAVEIAKASALIKAPAGLHWAPEEPYKDTFKTPVKTDPFQVPLGQKIDLLLAINKAVLAVNGVKKCHSSPATRSSSSPRSPPTSAAGRSPRSPSSTRRAPTAPPASGRFLPSAELQRARRPARGDCRPAPRSRQDLAPRRAPPARPEIARAGVPARRPRACPSTTPPSTRSCAAASGCGPRSTSPSWRRARQLADRCRSSGPRCSLTGLRPRAAALLARLNGAGAFVGPPTTTPRSAGGCPRPRPLAHARSLGCARRASSGRRRHARPGRPTRARRLGTSQRSSDGAARGGRARPRGEVLRAGAVRRRRPSASTFEALGALPVLYLEGELERQLSGQARRGSRRSPRCSVPAEARGARRDRSARAQYEAGRRRRSALRSPASTPGAAGAARRGPRREEGPFGPPLECAAPLKELDDHALPPGPVRRRRRAGSLGDERLPGRAAPPARLPHLLPGEPRRHVRGAADRPRSSPTRSRRRATRATSAATPAPIWARSTPGIRWLGRLPRPDLLACCTNICQTVLYWYRDLAARLRVPLVVIDTPFVYGSARRAPRAVRGRPARGGDRGRRARGRGGGSTGPSSPRWRGSGVEGQRPGLLRSPLPGRCRTTPLLAVGLLAASLVWSVAPTPTRATAATAGPAAAPWPWPPRPTATATGWWRRRAASTRSGTHARTAA